MSIDGVGAFESQKMPQEKEQTQPQKITTDAEVKDIIKKCAGDHQLTNAELQVLLKEHQKAPNENNDLKNLLTGIQGSDIDSSLTSQQKDQLGQFIQAPQSFSVDQLNNISGALTDEDVEGLVLASAVMTSDASTGKQLLDAIKNGQAANNIYQSVLDMDFQRIDGQPITSQQIDDLTASVNDQITSLKDQIKTAPETSKPALETQINLLGNIKDNLTILAKNPSNDDVLNNIKSDAATLRTSANQELKRIETGSGA